MKKQTKLVFQKKITVDEANALLDEYQVFVYLSENEVIIRNDFADNASLLSMPALQQRLAHSLERVSAWLQYKVQATNRLGKIVNIDDANYRITLFSRVAIVFPNWKWSENSNIIESLQENVAKAQREYTEQLELAGQATSQFNEKVSAAKSKCNDQIENLQKQLAEQKAKLEQCEKLAEEKE